MEEQALYQQVQAAATAHGEPASLVALRQAALDRFLAADRPNMARFDFHDWPLYADQPSLTFPAQPAVSGHLPAEAKAQGVILCDLFTALKRYPDLVAPHFLQIVPPTENQLTAYHAALVNSGTFLYLPKGVALQEPIELDLTQDSRAGQDLHAHLLIVAEAGSSVSVIQHTTTVGDQPSRASLMVEIAAGSDSRVNFAALDELGPNTLTYFKRRAQIGRNAKVEWAVGLMNGGDTVGDMDSELVGEGGEGDSKLIAVTTGAQRVGINNRVTHHGHHTTGNINQRGVLLGQSHLVFNGIGEIIHGAHGAQAEQQNRVLMMSPDCRGDANPILLIDENDVVAGHAASVGPVNPEQLNYLLTRGIPRPVAERLVIRGFLSAVLAAIPAKRVQEELIATLERKLTDGRA